ncbi:MAG: T9SS type A sorting domain-containing protein [bacterium]|nr:T9SS type A sorting domain-containing protein [bacterium]
MFRQFMFPSILIIVIALTHCGPAAGRDYQSRQSWYVSTTEGNDDTGDGSQANPYATIQRGIDRAGEVGSGLAGDNYANYQLENSILWGNCADLGSDQLILDTGTYSQAYFDCCDVDSSGVTGSGITYTGGKIHVDPEFCDPPGCGAAPTEESYGYTLAESSSCLEATCVNIGIYDAGCSGPIIFTNVAVQAGLAVPGRGRGVAWCSIGDRDLLDIFVAVNDGPLRLYENENLYAFLQVVDYLGILPDYNFGVYDPYFMSCSGTSSDWEAPPGIDWDDIYFGKLTDLSVNTACCMSDDSTDPDGQFTIDHNGSGEIERTISVGEVYDPDTDCWIHFARATGWFKISDPAGIEDFWVDFDLYGPFGCGNPDDCQPSAVCSGTIQLWEDDFRPLLCAAWASINLDRHGDIFVGNESAPDLLYIWDESDHQFVEVAAAAGIAGGNGSTRGASWVDIDGNGMMDLFLARDGLRNNLYLNTGGTPDPEAISFVDIGDDSLGMTDAARTRSAAWCDFDNDGDLDLYVVNLDGRNRLYVFDGLSCVEMGEVLGVDDAGTGIGCAWGDYDNDGDFDLYLTNNNEPNRLFKNNLVEGWLGFHDVAPNQGVADSRHSRSCAWVDYDNDGDLDLHVLNALGGDRLYENGTGGFTDIADELGMADEGDCVAAGWADYDADGDLDVYVSKQGAANALFSNSGNGNSWLHVDPRWGWLTHWPLIGARVTAIVDGRTQIREIGSTSGYMSQHSPAVEFGFGPGVGSVDSLIIRMPNGQIYLFTDVPTGQTFSDDPLTSVPESAPTFTLSQNFPNPFNPSTEIWFSLGAEEKVSVTIYDISGRLIRTLARNRNFTAGRRSLTWEGCGDDGRPLASGVYFCRLQVGERIETRKMLLLK